MVSILGSSAVERSTVNRLVAGSNPARGVPYKCHHRLGGGIFFWLSGSVFFFNRKKIAATCHSNQKISCRAERANLRATAPNPSQGGVFQGQAHHEDQRLISAQTQRS